MKSKRNKNRNNKNYANDFILCSVPQTSCKTVNVTRFRKVKKIPHSENLLRCYYLRY